MEAYLARHVVCVVPVGHSVCSELLAHLSQEQCALDNDSRSESCAGLEQAG